MCDCEYLVSLLDLRTQSGFNLIYLFLLSFFALISKIITIIKYYLDIFIKNLTLIINLIKFEIIKDIYIWWLRWTCWQTVWKLLLMRRRPERNRSWSVLSQRWSSNSSGSCKNMVQLIYSRLHRWVWNHWQPQVLKNRGGA